jgi:hypothetical protein
MAVRGRYAVFMSDVTRILSAIEQGDPTAAEQLLPLVFLCRVSHQPWVNRMTTAPTLTIPSSLVM